MTNFLILVCMFFLVKDHIEKHGFKWTVINAAVFTIVATFIERLA